MFLSRRHGDFNAVSAGSGLVVATGGTTSTYTAGGITYRVHEFTSSGTFSVSQAGLVDILLVGAGGGGGYATFIGGGGGAGQVVEQTNISVSAQSYQISIGQGGAGKNSFSSVKTGDTGGTTTALGLNAIGGNGGGTGTEVGPGGSSGNGFGGGTAGSGPNPAFYRAGGGGGATGAGENGVYASTTEIGRGGPGYSSNITGSTQIYATGGPGGNQAYTRYPGSGGNGNTGSSGSGGSGENGIVVIRYQIG